MKYLQTYEILYFDLKQALNNALGNFFKNINRDTTPNLYLIFGEDNNSCGFELSVKDENQKVLWCDVIIKDDFTFQLLELEIIRYNGKMLEEIEFIKSLIVLTKDKNFAAAVRGTIEKKDVKNFIKKLRKDDFELFVNAKKYNL